MCELTSSLQNIAKDEIEFIDDGYIGLLIGGSHFYDFYVQYELKLDVVRSTNGVGGATCDYTVDKFEITSLLDCFEDPIDPSTVNGFDVFKDKLKKILIEIELG